MRSSIHKNLIDPLKKGTIEPVESLCIRCGGNGYTKSSQNCYKTCLECYGLGSVFTKK